MKSEVLRIHNFSCSNNDAEKLVNVSLSLMAGETIGLLGLINSGANLLVEVLCSDMLLQQNSFYINRKPIFDFEEVHKMVYRITVSNYLINNWTIAEYISLKPQKGIFGWYKPEKLARETKVLFDQFGIEMDVNQKIKDISELDKRILDLVKAHSIGAKIVIIEDEFEGCSTEDLERFKLILDLMIEREIAVVVNSHSYNVTKILSDRYVILKKGRIVKKCEKSFVKNQEHAEKFMMDKVTTKRKVELDSTLDSQFISEQVIYSVNNINVKKEKHINLDFKKSEIVTILSLDIQLKERIFNLLSGRETNGNMSVYLEHQLLELTGITDYINHKIVSVVDMGGKEELLLSMSIGDNLLIPSLEKITSIQYLMSNEKLIKLLESEFKIHLDEIDENIGIMKVNELINLVLERWYIFKPKVLILFEPFVHCDIYDVSLVKSYVKKFAALGTTVIIVKSREENIVDISDRIIRL